jgi:hypothetical protein
MNAGGSLEFAYARICARYGARPDAVAWRTIEVIRGLPALLDAARTSPFRHWTAGIAPDADAHAIESVLRRHARELVLEVGSWMPESWRPAVDWAGALADLAVIAHLARGEKVLPWMLDDPVYRECVEGGAALSIAGQFAPLAPASKRPDALLRAWRMEWARRAPGGMMSDPSIFDAFAHALTAHRAELGSATLTDGTPLRRALVARLELLFRRAVESPAVAFIFLALSALDLERLRGELVRRAIFARFAPAR